VLTPHLLALLMLHCPVSSSLPLKTTCALALVCHLGLGVADATRQAAVLPLYVHNPRWK
jgi:hypothetical protein